jgi:hypothetical protein
MASLNDRKQGKGGLWGFRQDQFALSLNVNGHDCGYWDKKTGGELDSDETKYYAGAMDTSLSLGGRRTPGNITLQRLFGPKDVTTDLKILYNAVGRGAAKIAQFPLDKDGNLYGAGHITWNGTVKRVAAPDVDSEGTGASLIEVEITVDSAPSVGS